MKLFLLTGCALLLLSTLQEARADLPNSCVNDFGWPFPGGSWTASCSHCRWEYADGNVYLFYNCADYNGNTQIGNFPIYKCVKPIVLTNINGSLSCPGVN